MADINIDVLVTDQGVAAQRNRKGADPDDTVIWNFIPASSTFQVVFREFQDPNGTTQRIPPAQVPVSGSLSTTRGVDSGIVLNVPAGLYVYDIQDSNGNTLPWLNPISPTQTFGGLDIPRPPGG